MKLQNNMTAPKFNLVISKVNQLLFEGEAISVNLPGAEGEFTVLAHHEPIISMLKEGTIKILDGNDSKEFEIASGLCEVHNNLVTILV
jgi:F-type H+-transporting ATPase subunit epsilon